MSRRESPFSPPPRPRDRPRRSMAGWPLRPGDRRRLPVAARTARGGGPRAWSSASATRCGAPGLPGAAVAPLCGPIWPVPGEWLAWLPGASRPAFSPRHSVV